MDDVVKSDRVKGQHLTAEVETEVLRLRAAGQSHDRIAVLTNVSRGSVYNVLLKAGGVEGIRAEEPVVSPYRLSLDDRVSIRLGLIQHDSYATIGASLPIPRNKSTIWREVARNGGVEAYRPLTAHRRAQQQAARPKPTKLASNLKLCALVIQGLTDFWSPQQISADLKRQFGDDQTMTVSHETIYKTLYVQGLGELRRELTRCLRSGRARRRPQGRVTSQGKMPGMVMISERPAEVEDRAVPGHWEGDLIIGAHGNSAVGTLVERTSRYVMLLHLHNKTAEEVRQAMTTAITALPEHLARSVTWDQGKEMAQHLQFTVETGIPIYFCDPHSPWQRGSNENTNGLLRQYMPKGTDLGVHTQADLEAIAHSLNRRPRETLGWDTPAQALAQIVAPTP